VAERIGVETRIRDLVVGDRLAVFGSWDVHASSTITKVQHGPGHIVSVWYDSDEHPYHYDGRHGLNVIRTVNDVLRDLVEIALS